MIAILNDNGLRLDLKPDQNLVTEQVAAWVTDSDLPGEFSYPIEAPLNENNRRFVGHGYRPDASLPNDRIPVTVRLNNVLYRRATYVYRRVGESLSGYLLLDAGQANDQLRGLTLQQAVPDVIDLGDGLQTSGPNLTTKSLETRMAEIAALPPGRFPCTFFPIRNEAFFESDIAGKVTGYLANAYINAWFRFGDGSFGFVTDSATIKGYPVVPQFYLAWVLERIMTRIGYRIESDWLASAEIQQLVIVNFNAITRQQASGIAASTLNHRVTAAYHLPEMSVSDFLKALKGRFGLTFTYSSNEKVCYISQYVMAVAKGAAVDLTLYQTGTYEAQNTDAGGFTITEALEETDELNRDPATGELRKPATYVVGKGQQPLSLKVSTTQLAYDKAIGFDGGFWFVPTVRQAGNITDPAYEKSERYVKEGKRTAALGLRLLSYRGMTSSAFGSPYPLATPGTKNGQQQRISQQAIALGGYYGGWNQHLRPYYQFRTLTIPITQRLLLPPGVLSGLKLHQPVSLSLESQIRRSYLPAKVQAQAPGRDGLVLVRLDALTIPTGLDQPDDPQGAAQPWVEFVIGAEQFTGDRFGVHTATRSYSVRLWKDAARTTPAVVANLVIYVRRKREVIYNRISFTPGVVRIDYDETVLTYKVSGSTATLEASYITDELRSVVNDTGDKADGLIQSLQLDPGEEYTIL